MSNYELTLVVSSDLTEEKQKSLITKIKKILTEANGSLVKEGKWEKKQLAYLINHNQSAFYYYGEISLPSESVAAVDKKIRIEEEIIRYLLVKGESPKKVKKDGAKVAK